jgi:hypothetical protein
VCKNSEIANGSRISDLQQLLALLQAYSDIQKEETCFAEYTKTLRQDVIYRHD